MSRIPHPRLHIWNERRLFLVFACLFSLLAAGFLNMALLPVPKAHAASQAAHVPSTVPTPSTAGLHVAGNELENNRGQVVRLLGVDRSGTEYQCTKPGVTSAFDGPADAASVTAMVSWNINAVRVPLNEDCWLGINGEPAAAFSAASYQIQIINYVYLLKSYNLTVILDLHWNAPGATQAIGQEPMPDVDHSVLFWAEVASTFLGNSQVVFDLYNEPFTTSWSCWLNGSTAAYTSPCGDVPFAAAGMQTLVNRVRQSGASNVIMLGGLAYANNLSQWVQYMPSDPDNNLAASWHLYNFNACVTTACWAAQVMPVAVRVPVVAGELGENDCASGFINTAMAWLDQTGISYLGWAWNADFNCNTGPALISDYTGTATPFGQGLKNHLAAFGPLVPQCAFVDQYAYDGTSAIMEQDANGNWIFVTTYVYTVTVTITNDGPLDAYAWSFDINFGSGLEYFGGPRGETSDYTYLDGTDGQVTNNASNGVVWEGEGTVVTAPIYVWLDAPISGTLPPIMYNGNCNLG
jgi:hypothetical protein